MSNSTYCSPFLCQKKVQNMSTIAIANDTNTTNAENWGLFFLPSFSLCILVAITGTIGNLLSFIIFIRPRFRANSINIFLAFMSVSDLTLFTFCFPVYAVGPLVGVLAPTLELQKLYAFSVCYLYPIATMFHCSSVWLLVAVTVERWFAVCRPFVAQIQHTKRAKFTSLTIVFISILTNVVRFWEFKINQDGISFDGLLRENANFMLWYLTIITLLQFYFIPLIIVIYFNCRIVIELRKSNNRRHALSMGQHENRQTTRMIVSIVTYFIISYTPALCLSILEVMNKELFQSKWGILMSDINNLTVLTHSASSFLFYLKFSSRYRLEAKLIISYIFCLKSYRERLKRKTDEFRALYSLVNNSPSITKRRKARMPLKDKLSDPLFCSFMETTLSDEGKNKNGFLGQSPRRKKRSASCKLLYRHVNNQSCV